MSDLSTLPKGDSAWLLRKAIERIIQQVSVLETNIGSSTTGNSSNTQVIFNDNGTLRGDPDLTFNTALNRLIATNLESTAALTVGTTATITGDLTVATDRLKVVTASTAVQTGATTQIQVGTTAWPTTVIGKSGSRAIFGNEGNVNIWNEAAAVAGNYSSLIIGAKTAVSATTMSGLQIRGGIENASDQAGFCSFWTSPTGGGFLERYKIDSTGISTWSVAGSTAMTLNSTGLGIGASPSSLLYVKKSQNTDTTLIVNNENSGTAATARLDLQSNINNYLTLQSYGQNYSNTVCGIAAAKLNTVLDNASTAFSSGLLIGTVSTNPLYFVTANAVKMTLDASGQLGIGTTTPAYKLEVATGTTGQQALANFRTADTTAANNAGVLIYATPSSTAASRSVLLTLDADGANASGGDYFFIEKLGNSGQVNLNLQSNAAMTFQTNGTERARFNNTGAFVLAGGTANANGIGVAFPTTQSASSDANCLDDYEEGAWVPVATAGAGAFTSVTGEVGRYTKIGRMVTATGFFKIVLNGTGSSFIQLDGLPFAVGSMNNIGVGRVDATTGNMFQIKLNAFGTIGNIWTYNNTYPGADGAEFPMTLVYYV